MPFASKAQQRYLYAKHPEVAKEFAQAMKEEHRSYSSLPTKVKHTEAMKKRLKK